MEIIGVKLSPTGNTLPNRSVCPPRLSRPLEDALLSIYDELFGISD